MIDSSPVSRKRWLLFCCWGVLSSLVFIRPLLAFVRLSLSQDDASYLVLIPFISVWVLFVERDGIFRNLSSDKTLGNTFLVLAGCGALVSRLARDSPLSGLQLSGWILSLVLVWIAGFAFLFGRATLRASRFPLLFLMLMVPPPDYLIDRIIYILQEGSAWIAGAFFDLVGVPALRDGLVFHLARVNIEVSKECSGIRSSMALLVLALLISHFRLRDLSHKILFIACGLLMMFIKNGIRIATLTILAIYVDPGFLFGRLHHQGGVIFFVVALLLLLPLLLLLQRWESKGSMISESAQTSQPSRP